MANAMTTKTPVSTRALVGRLLVPVPVGAPGWKACYGTPIRVGFQH